MHQLQSAFEDATRYARRPKPWRWISRPWRHALGFFLAYGWYRWTGKGTVVRSTLFTGDTVAVPLPAGLELYLTGIKTHDSEIRLVRYLFRELHAGDQVVDAGAHLGYFTLLMARLVTDSGSVFGFEPGARVLPYLKNNVSAHPQIRIEEQVLSDRAGSMIFHDYPLQYSEFNTVIATSQHIPHQTRTVTAVSLDAWCAAQHVHPVFLKIDVEGGELAMLQGARNLLAGVRAIAIEIRKEDFERLYAPVIAFLDDHGFAAYRIENDGNVIGLADVRSYLSGLVLESDNIIFRQKDVP